MGLAAYRLALPLHLSQVHNVFHVSMLCKYLPDPNRQTEQVDVQIDERLTVPKMPVRTIDEQVRKLRNKQILMVKVQWQHQGVQDFSWETRALMEHQYLYMFTT
ncbi:unnamed protein product [Victoria cruziana]